MNTNEGQIQSFSNSSGVRWGHLGIIGLCALILLFTTWMKSGFSFNLHASAGNSDLAVVTYDQAKAEATAQSPAQSDPTDNGLDQQLAAVDPGNFSGDVLGASVTSNLFPPADQMVTQAMLDQIKITTVPTSSDSIKKYSDKLVFAEAQNNALGMLADLNSDDAETLQNIQAQSKAIVGDMSKIAVPEELVTYHKMKMMYYTTLGYMAQAFVGDPNIDMQSLTNILFSLTEKLNATENDVMNKYNVQL